FATQFGLPVSTTHVVTGSVMGAGASQRLSALRWGVGANIVLAWVLTIPAAGLMAWVVYAILNTAGLRGSRSGSRRGQIAGGGDFPGCLFEHPGRSFLHLRASPREEPLRDQAFEQLLDNVAVRTEDEVAPAKLLHQAQHAVTARSLFQFLDGLDRELGMGGERLNRLHAPEIAARKDPVDRFPFEHAGQGS